MIGFATGISFQIDKVSASIGVGWEHGTGSDDLFPSTLPIPPYTGGLTLDTFSLLFSFSFRFLERGRSAVELHLDPAGEVELAQGMPPPTAMLVPAGPAQMLAAR